MRIETRFSRMGCGPSRWLWHLGPALFAACQNAPTVAPKSPEPSSVAAPTKSSDSPAAAPLTKTLAVADEYHGVKVVEEYRWLEAAGSRDVASFNRVQNAHARRFLDALPGRAKVAARIDEVYRAEQPRYPWLEVSGDRWFVLVNQPPKQQPFVVVMPAGEHPAKARVLIDPSQIDPSGKTSIDWYLPSPDGKLVAVSLSVAGSEIGDVHLVDVESGKLLEERVPRVNGGTAGGDLAWTSDGRGFFYTRYPRVGERPEEDLSFYQQVYFHELGTPTERDRYEIGKDFPRIAENQLDVDLRTGRILLTVQNGDGGEFAHYLRARDGKWRQFSSFGDKTVQAVFLPSSEDLLVISRQGSPNGELLRVDGRTLDVEGAKVPVPAGEGALVSDFWGNRTLLAEERLVFTTYQLGGPSELRVFDHQGTRQRFAMPFEVASVSGLVRDAKLGTLFRSEGFLTPRSWYQVDRKTGHATNTKLTGPMAFDTRGYEVRREFAVSKDGTRVPLNILAPKNVKLDGSHPCVATGYGGYGISLAPRFRVESGLWLEQGVLLVVANLRGGGEFGEAWHRAGNLTNKQNVFDDFQAVLEHLIERGYTSSERLGIIGGSNGGLLMGATLVQRPELVRAVVSYVGIYDMLRVELSPNGAFNVTEFGSVKDKAQFEAIYAYSPYHHVRDGVHYPATLFLTGENDPRVDPMQSRKMIAKLQAKSAGTAPLLLRTSSNTGHGGDTDLDEEIAQETDVFSFMLHALGVVPRSTRASLE